MKPYLIKNIPACVIITCCIILTACSQDSAHGDDAIDSNNGTEMENRYNDSINRMGDSTRLLPEDTTHSGPNKSE